MLEYLDIIKELNKIDEAEKTTGLNKAVMNANHAELKGLMQETDKAQEEFKKASDFAEHRLKFKRIPYTFGIIAIVALLLTFIRMFNKNGVDISISNTLFIVYFSTFIISFIGYLVSDKYIQDGIYRWKSKRADFVQYQNNLILHYLTTLVYGYKLDLAMYKDIYQKIYDVQEYLRENDKRGFNSFEKAFKALNIDLSRYTESEEPHIHLTDLPDNPYDSVEKDKKNE